MDMHSLEIRRIRGKEGSRTARIKKVVLLACIGCSIGLNFASSKRSQKLEQ